MTSKKDLKRLIRDRQARTGESYMAARHQVMERLPRPAFSVVEAVDLSSEAARLGLRSPVRAYPGVTARADATVVLERLRDVLLATTSDPTTEPLRSQLIHGEPPRLPRLPPSELLEEEGRFIVRARAGIGGLSDSGRLLALPIDGHAGPVMILCILHVAPPVGILIDGVPSVVLATPEDLQIDDEILALVMPRASPR